jgi:hypothetical protein
MPQIAKNAIYFAERRDFVTFAVKIRTHDEKVFVRFVCSPDVAAGYGEDSGDVAGRGRSG